MELSILWLIPLVQDFVSSSRLGTWAQDFAGTRDSTSGQKIGHAALPWAFSEAVVLFLRQHAATQKLLARVEKKSGKGKVLTVFAHT